MSAGFTFCILCSTPSTNTYGSPPLIEPIPRILNLISAPVSPPTPPPTASVAKFKPAILPCKALVTSVTGRLTMASSFNVATAAVIVFLFCVSIPTTTTSSSTSASSFITSLLPSCLVTFTCNGAYPTYVTERVLPTFP